MNEHWSQIQREREKERKRKLAETLAALSPVAQAAPYASGTQAERLDAILRYFTGGAAPTIGATPPVMSARQAPSGARAKAAARGGTPAKPPSNKAQPARPSVSSAQLLGGIPPAPPFASGAQDARVNAILQYFRGGAAPPAYQPPLQPPASSPSAPITGAVVGAAAGSVLPTRNRASELMRQLPAGQPAPLTVLPFNADSEVLAHLERELSPFTPRTFPTEAAPSMPDVLAGNRLSWTQRQDRSVLNPRTLNPYEAGAPAPDPRTLAGVMYLVDQKYPNLSPKQRDVIKYTIQREMEQKGNSWDSVKEALVGALLRGPGAAIARAPGFATSIGEQQMDELLRLTGDVGATEITGAVAKAIGPGAYARPVVPPPPAGYDEAMGYWRESQALHQVPPDKQDADYWLRLLNSTSETATRLGWAPYLNSLIREVHRYAGREDANPLIKALMGSPVSQAITGVTSGALTLTDPLALTGFVTGLPGMVQQGTEGYRTRGWQGVKETFAPDPELETYDIASTVSPLAIMTGKMGRGAFRKRPAPASARRTIAGTTGQKAQERAAAGRPVEEAGARPLEETVLTEQPETTRLEGSILPDQESAPPVETTGPQTARKPEAPRVAPGVTFKSARSGHTFTVIEKAPFERDGPVYLVRSTNGSNTYWPESTILEKEQSGEWVRIKSASEKAARSKAKPKEPVVEAPPETLAPPTVVEEGGAPPKGRRNRKKSLDRLGAVPGEETVIDAQTVPEDKGQARKRRGAAIISEEESGADIQQLSEAERAPSESQSSAKVSVDELSALDEDDLLAIARGEANVDELTPKTKSTSAKKGKGASFKLKGGGALAAGGLLAGALAYDALGGSRGFEEERDEAAIGLAPVATAAIATLIARRLKAKGYDPAHFKRTVQEVLHDLWRERKQQSKNVLAKKGADDTLEAIRRRISKTDVRGAEDLTVRHIVDALGAVVTDETPEARAQAAALARTLIEDNEAARKILNDAINEHRESSGVSPWYEEFAHEFTNAPERNLRPSRSSLGSTWKVNDEAALANPNRITYPEAEAEFASELTTPPATTQTLSERARRMPVLDRIKARVNKAIPDDLPLDSRHGVQDVIDRLNKHADEDSPKLRTADDLADVFDLSDEERQLLRELEQDQRITTANTLMPRSQQQRSALLEKHFGTSNIFEIANRLEKAGVPTVEMIERYRARVAARREKVTRERANLVQTLEKKRKSLEKYSQRVAQIKEELRKGKLTPEEAAQQLREADSIKARIQGEIKELQQQSMRGRNRHKFDVSGILGGKDDPMMVSVVRVHNLLRDVARGASEDAPFTREDLLDNRDAYRPIYEQFGLDLGLELSIRGERTIDVNSPEEFWTTVDRATGKNSPIRTVVSQMTPEQVQDVIDGARELWHRVRQQYYKNGKWSLDTPVYLVDPVTQGRSSKASDVNSAIVSATGRYFIGPKQLEQRIRDAIKREDLTALATDLQLWHKMHSGRFGKPVTLRQALKQGYLSADLPRGTITDVESGVKELRAPLRTKARVETIDSLTRQLKETEAQLAEERQTRADLVEQLNNKKLKAADRERIQAEIDALDATSIKDLMDEQARLRKRIAMTRKAIAAPSTYGKKAPIIETAEPKPTPFDEGLLKNNARLRQLFEQRKKLQEQLRKASGAKQKAIAREIAEIDAQVARQWARRSEALREEQARQGGAMPRKKGGLAKATVVGTLIGLGAIATSPAEAAGTDRQEGPGALSSMLKVGVPILATTLGMRGITGKGAFSHKVARFSRGVGLGGLALAVMNLDDDSLSGQVAKTVGLTTAMSALGGGVLVHHLTKGAFGDMSLHDIGRSAELNKRSLIKEMVNTYAEHGPMRAIATEFWRMRGVVDRWGPKDFARTVEAAGVRQAEASATYHQEFWDPIERAIATSKVEPHELEQLFHDTDQPLNYAESFAYRRTQGEAPRNEVERVANEQLNDLFTKLNDYNWEAGGGIWQRQGAIDNPEVVGARVRVKIGKAWEEGVISELNSDTKSVTIRLNNGDVVTPEADTYFKRESVVNVETYWPRLWRPSLIKDALIASGLGIDELDDIATGKTKHHIVGPGLARNLIKILDHMVKQGATANRGAAWQNLLSMMGKASQIEITDNGATISKAREAPMSLPDDAYHYNLKDVISSHILETTISTEMHRTFGPDLLSLAETLQQTPTQLQEFLKDYTWVELGGEIGARHLKPVKNFIGAIVAHAVTVPKLAWAMSTTLAQAGVLGLQLASYGPKASIGGAMRYALNAARWMHGAGFDLAEALQHNGFRTSAIRYALSGRGKHAAAYARGFQLLRKSGLDQATLTHAFDLPGSNNVVDALMASVKYPDMLFRRVLMLSADIHLHDMAMKYEGGKGALDKHFAELMREQYRLTDEEIRQIGETPKGERAQVFGTRLRQAAYKQATDTAGNPSRSNMPLHWHTNPAAKALFALQSFTYVTTFVAASFGRDLQVLLSKKSTGKQRTHAAQRLGYLLAGTGLMGLAIDEGRESIYEKLLGKDYKSILEKMKEEDAGNLVKGFSKALYRSLLASGVYGFFNDFSMESTDALRSTAQPIVLRTLFEAAENTKKTISSGDSIYLGKQADQMLGRTSVVRAVKPVGQYLEKARRYNVKGTTTRKGLKWRLDPSIARELQRVKSGIQRMQQPSGGLR